MMVHGGVHNFLLFTSVCVSPVCCSCSVLGVHACMGISQDLWIFLATKYVSSYCASMF